MSRRTPSKTEQKIVTTYVDCTWSINSRGTVYVRVKPVLAKQLGGAEKTTFHRLGRVKSVHWTKALKIQGESTYDYVFKFMLNTEPSVQRRDHNPADYPDTLFALKESKITDLSQDKAAKAHFNNNFSRSEPLHKAHSNALKDSKLKSDGKWLKALYPAGQTDNTAVSPAISHTNKVTQDKAPTTTAWQAFQTVANVNNSNKSTPSSSSSSAAPSTAQNPLIPDQNMFLASQGDPPSTQGTHTMNVP